MSHFIAMTSPISSLHQNQSVDPSPSLDSLVGHLLAAKRALACVEHVSQANSLVTSTRAALEIHTAQNARMQFLQSGCSAQIRILHKVQSYTLDLVRESRSDHAAVARRLQVADEQLNRTLDQLRTTIVESSLRPDDEQPKSLADFIDETNVQGLRDTINDTLSSFDHVKQGYEALNKALNQEITQAEGLLVAEDECMATSESSSLIPEMLSKMEGHAQEMASNLESREAFRYVHYGHQAYRRGRRSCI